jgi:uncharacterized sporulation protein YeaH/YhbH (DUF444 family)
MREAVKRRASTNSDVLITNEDLRFRQLKKKKTPESKAVCIYALDISGSMTDEHRKLAKSFFFWSRELIRRTYPKCKSEFVVHTTKAEEVPEDQFFGVRGDGGTIMSTCLSLVNDIINDRYSNGYNIYFIHASDGDNFYDDTTASNLQLDKILDICRLAGYIEIMRFQAESGYHKSGCMEVFDRPSRNCRAVALASYDGVFEAIKAMFKELDDET